MEFVGRDRSRGPRDPRAADARSRDPHQADPARRPRRRRLRGRRTASSSRRNQHRSRMPVTMLDPAPRVVLDPEWGMLTVGATAVDASIAADVYHHTIDVLTTCEDRLGGWAPLDRGPPLRRRVLGPGAGEAAPRWRRAAARRPGRRRHRRGVRHRPGVRAGAARARRRGGRARPIATSVADTFAGPAWLGRRVPTSRTADEQRAAIERGRRALRRHRHRRARCRHLRPDRVRRRPRPGGVALGDVRQPRRDGRTRCRVLHPFLARSPVGGRVVLIGSKNVHGARAPARLRTRRRRRR